MSCTTPATRFGGTRRNRREAAANHNLGDTAREGRRPRPGCRAACQGPAHQALARIGPRCAALLPRYCGLTRPIFIHVVRLPMRLRPALLVPVVALAACNHERALGPQAGALRLSVTPARSVLSLGDSTTVVVSLRNLGADSVSLRAGGCPILPYITAQPSGQIVYPEGGNWFCIDILARFTLAPGAEQAETLLVRTGAVSSAAHPPVSLTRGRYLVYATFSSLEVSLRAESVPLTVQ